MNAFCTTATPAIDFIALDARCTRNVALVNRILAKFTVQLDEDLARLNNAVDASNTVEAAELAHRIKGTAGSVEAIRLRENASIAETFALEGKLTELRNCLIHLSTDRAEIRAEIGCRLSSFNAGSTLVET